jgi:molybdate transport system ATP-binding protein
MSTAPIQASARSHAGLHVQLHSTRPVPLNAQFDCAPGELVALVGASGSGKTTLLRSIAGLHQASDLQGRITLGSQVWMDSAPRVRLAAQQRRVGLVFQHYALFPHLNAIQNIATYVDFIPGSKGFLSSTAIELAQQWLKRFGLEEVGQRLPRALSGGQQQRVALARALVRVGASPALTTPSSQAQPAVQTAEGVLLLDEPFSAVDAPMRQVLYRELAQLRQSLRMPIVLVTHDLQEARRLADRIVIIDAGQSLQSAPPAQLLRSPRNARVAQLVGIHNHFAGRFEKREPGLAHLHWGELALRVIDKNKIDDGAQVTWVLAGETVQIDPSANALPPHANHLHCEIAEMLLLGEISICRLAVSGTSDHIQLNLPTAQLAQMQAQIGGMLYLAVPPEGVHIMPLKQTD